LQLGVSSELDALDKLEAVIQKEDAFGTPGQMIRVSVGAAKDASQRVGAAYKTLIDDLQEKTMIKVTKHINVRYHFTREIVESKEIEVAKMGTKVNAADAFTKVVPGPKFNGDT
ncbi:hypothetical protein Tco_1160691, partial [Tanacetum coccineum]